MKMKVRKQEILGASGPRARWTVRWVMDETPRRYVAYSWGEAMAFACAQIRAMKESTR